MIISQRVWIVSALTIQEALIAKIPYEGSFIYLSPSNQIYRWNVTI